MLNKNIMSIKKVQGQKEAACATKTPDIQKITIKMCMATHTNLWSFYLTWDSTKIKYLFFVVYCIPLNKLWLLPLIGMACILEWYTSGEKANLCG